MPGHQPNQDDRSGKRRRIDAVAAAHLYPTAPSAYGSQHLPYNTAPQHHHAPSYADGSHYVARQPPGSHLATPYSGAPSSHPGQWTHSYSQAPPSYVSSYQDPRSVQQPYYYGQTDPSVYNSPWPPTQQDAQSNVHVPSMLATSQPPALPYLQPSNQPAHQPTHSPADSQQSYETGPSPSYATTLQNFDVGQFGLGHDVHSQHQQHVRKSPSNMYFEDASMHLKMQSLPILDSLVSNFISHINFTQLCESHHPSRIARPRSWCLRFSEA